MHKIAFICRRGPHGTATGREGLDALLATSAMTESLALFLIGDGVLQLLRSSSRRPSCSVTMRQPSNCLSSTTSRRSMCVPTRWPSVA